eukprot:4613980-Pleurochrysis_carterae.AAC.2
MRIGFSCSHIKFAEARAAWRRWWTTWPRKSTRCGHSSGLSQLGDCTGHKRVAWQVQAAKTSDAHLPVRFRCFKVDSNQQLAGNCMRTLILWQGCCSRTERWAIRREAARMHTGSIAARQGIRWAYRACGVAEVASTMREQLIFSHHAVYGSQRSACQ